MLALWIATLVHMRSRQNPRRDWMWIWPVAFLVIALAWYHPMMWDLSLVYLHPARRPVDPRPRNQADAPGVPPALPCLPAGRAGLPGLSVVEPGLLCRSGGRRPLDDASVQERRPGPDRASPNMPAPICSTASRRIAWWPRTPSLKRSTTASGCWRSPGSAGARICGTSRPCRWADARGRGPGPCRSSSLLSAVGVVVLWLCFSRRLSADARHLFHGGHGPCSRRDPLPVASPLMLRNS